LETVTIYQKFKDDQDKLDAQKFDEKIVFNEEEYVNIEVSKLKAMKLWDQVDECLEVMAKFEKQYDKLPKDFQGYLCDD
jgi:hypothetical protein